MNKILLLNELSNLLEQPVENLNDNYLLESNPLWDSLTLVSTIALIDRHYAIVVKGSDIQNCKTAGDIFMLLNQRLGCSTHENNVK